MNRKYTPEVLEKIRSGEKTVTERDLPILIKPLPDEARPGMLDASLYASFSPMVTGLRGFVVRQLMRKRKGMDAQQMRKMMNGIKSIPIIGDVSVQSMTVPGQTSSIPVRVYRKYDSTDAHKPVFYYIHGGGFVAGSPDVVEEMCKLIVHNLDCVSVSVDYRLAPECPFPDGFDDCYDVLKWLFAHAEEIGGDPARIMISGDSAGGNLATVCAMKCRDEGINAVKAQALLYPTVNMAGHNDDDYHYSLDQYEIAPEHKQVVEGMLGLMSGSTTGSISGMLGVSDAIDPYLSPYLGDLRNMPPCIILFGEFDFLRLEDEAYARKLKKSGVPVKTVRYAGMSHGFADMIGVQPQAEDCMIEVGRFMREYV